MCAGKGLFTNIRAALAQLRAAGVNYRVLFLDADDAVLVRRFEQGRRPHPLQADGRILDGIAAEREVLRSQARLRRRRRHHRLQRARPGHRGHRAVLRCGPIVLRLNVMSFGFKYGLPVDANFVADVRFIPTRTGSRSCARRRAWTSRCGTSCWPPPAPKTSSAAT
jgi:UPF0042 nucleotide-binding protein